MLSWMPWFIVFQSFVFYFSGMYARIWRYTSIFDLFAILRSSLIAFSISLIYVLIWMGSTGYPRSVLLLYLILNSILIIVLRLSVRIYFSHYHKKNPVLYDDRKKRLLLIGAGKTADKIAREILTVGRDQYDLIGFVDDDKEKHGALMHEKKILGSLISLSSQIIPLLR